MEVELQQVNVSTLKKRIIFELIQIKEKKIISNTAFLQEHAGMSGISGKSVLDCYSPQINKRMADDGRESHEQKEEEKCTLSINHAGEILMG